MLEINREITLEAILGKERVPHDAEDRVFLERVLEARKLWQEGDRSGIKNFPVGVKSREQAKKLKSELKSLHQATPVLATAINVPESAFAVAGEIKPEEFGLR